jgi:hypothetical protein
MYKILLKGEQTNNRSIVSLEFILVHPKLHRKKTDSKKLLGKLFGQHSQRFFPKDFEPSLILYFYLFSSKK